MNSVELTLLGSGSKGNCTAIVYQEQVLLVDAGFSAKELQRRMALAGIDSTQVVGSVISHEHEDHMQAARILSKRNGDFPVFCNSLTAERLHYAKKAPENLILFNNGYSFPIGVFRVTPFSTSHDAVDPVMFTVECGERKIAVATDLGYAGKMIKLKMHDCDAIVLESNHDPVMLRASSRPPNLKCRILGRRGHLSNEAAAALLPEIVTMRTRYVILAHLSEDCNTVELAQRTSAKTLKELGRDGMQLVVAQQDAITPTLSL